MSTREMAQHFHYGKTYRITPSRIFITKLSEIGYRIDPVSKSGSGHIYKYACMRACVCVCV